MDANGGCGPVLRISQSVCQTPNQALHHCLYYIKLWLENVQESILLLTHFVHRNTISIHVSGSSSRIPSQH